jgi:hypothetical protein
MLATIDGAAAGLEEIMSSGTVTVVAETIAAGAGEAAGYVVIGGTAAGAKTLPPTPKVDPKVNRKAAGAAAVPKVDGGAAGMLLAAVAEARATSVTERHSA